jgi:uncharacterized protein YyaL (SSP411 family)
MAQCFRLFRAQFNRRLAVLALVGASLFWHCGSGDRFARNLCRAAEPQPAEKTGATNHLSGESSPYLLQHAHNPVQWYPWGPEAFARAKQENKPIFLSIGYSTCYWCHVMERESFEDQGVAKILNENFIAIKVDREERPEIDEQYMLAAHLLTGRGGWPNSLWLTPDRKPFLAATYLPKQRFKDALIQVAAAWRDKPEAIRQRANQLSDAIRAADNLKPAVGAKIDQQAIDQAIADVKGNFDAQRGGFGIAPKFPPHGRLLLLVEEYRRSGDKLLLKMITRTLDAMADGGIHDQIGGGFHRYATDADWFLPHFEKMLYDNAQLLRLYTDAYLLTKNARYRQVVQDIATWVKREMTDSQGGFYSALDAESEGEEGKFYTWQYSTLLQTLGDADGRRFAREYGAQPDGNWVEQRSGKKPGTNILSRRHTATDDFSAMRVKLLAVRDKRPRPRLDDKVLAGWNGLMIESLAYAGRSLNEPEYTAAAEKAADFILSQMWQDGRLLHTYRNGQSRIPGYLDDYAYVARGLIELETSTKSPRWQTAAVQVADAMLKQFEDAEQGAFFFTPAGGDVPLMRSKNLFGGGNLPGANGVAAEVLMRLADLDQKSAYEDAAQRTLASLAGVATQKSSSDESLLLATAYRFRTKSKSHEAPAKDLASTASRADAQLHEPSVDVRLYSSKTAVAPGESFRVIVEFDILRGWHLYAPGSSKSVRAATVELQPNEQASVSDSKFPPGRELKDQVVKDNVRILEGVVRYELTVAIGKHAPSGQVELKFSVQTQACDDRTCFAPRKSVLSLPITIDPKATDGDKRHPEIFGAPPEK